MMRPCFIARWPNLTTSGLTLSLLMISLSGLWHQAITSARENASPVVKACGVDARSDSELAFVGVEREVERSMFEQELI